MSIVTVYRSDVHISATHRAYMDTHDPALRYPAYLENDLCDIVHYPDIMTTALAYRVRAGEEHLLPCEGALTVVDVDAIPLAALVAGSLGRIYLVPRDLIDLTAGLWPALLSVSDDDLAAVFDRYAEQISEVLPRTAHESVIIEVGSLVIDLVGDAREMRRAAHLDVQAVTDRLSRQPT